MSEPKMPLRPTCLADIAHIPIGRLIGAEVRDKDGFEGTVFRIEADQDGERLYLAAKHPFANCCVSAPMQSFEILALPEMPEQRLNAEKQVQVLARDQRTGETTPLVAANKEFLSTGRWPEAAAPEAPKTCTCDPAMKHLRGCRCGAGGTA